jgi:hypothetical protein
MKRTGLASRSAVKAHERRQRAERVRELKREFRIAAARTGCVMCWAEPVDRETRTAYRVQFGIRQAHHIIPKRYLQGVDERKWDSRNAMGLCQYHHMRHEGYAQRVPRALLGEEVFEFAREWNLEWLLDREYPA